MLLSTINWSFSLSGLGLGLKRFVGKTGSRRQLHAVFLYYIGDFGDQADEVK